MSSTWKTAFCIGRKQAALWGMCAVLCLASGCGKGKAEAPQGKFQEGRNALIKGQFQPAIESLNEHLKRNPKGPLASRASFLIGKAYMGIGDWKAAETWFQKTIDNFPQSVEDHKARYKLAMVMLLKGDAKEAKKRFDELVKFPSGPYTPEATAMAKYLDKPEKE